MWLFTTCLKQCTGIVSKTPEVDVLMKKINDISAEAEYRSRLEQQSTLKSQQPVVLDIIKKLVLHHGYTIVLFNTEMRNHNIWCYAEPTPSGKVSINPHTKYRAHNVLRVFIGTSLDFNTFLLQELQTTQSQIAFKLLDCAFEEIE